MNLIKKDKKDSLTAIEDITLEIAYHEHEIARHQRIIQRLKNEKSTLIAKGCWLHRP